MSMSKSKCVVEVDTIMLSGIFPNDIMMEILARLPAKSLIRFKFVCKSWYLTVAKDKKFIHKHYETTSSTPGNSYLLVERYVQSLEEHQHRCHRDHYHNPRRRRPCPPPPMRLSLLRDEPGYGIKWVDLKEPFHKLWNWYQVPFHGASGLLCVPIWDSRKEICSTYLWNPATREHMRLPSTEIGQPHPRDFERVDFAFGFVNKTSDYKVIRIWHFRGLSASYSTRYKVDVWSLNNSTSESWRSIDSVPPGILLGCRFYLKGKCYWVTIRVEFLIWFDFETEVFGTLQLPVGPLVKPNAKPWHRIIVLNDTIACISSPIPANGGRCEIWLMNEDGDGDNMKISWNKYKTLDSCWKNWYIKTCWKNDHLTAIAPDQFVCFGLGSEERMEADLSLYHLHEPIIYNECLISLPKQQN